MKSQSTTHKLKVAESVGGCEPKGGELEEGLSLDTSDADSTSVFRGNTLEQLLHSKQALPSEPPEVFPLDPPAPTRALLGAARAAQGTNAAQKRPAGTSGETDDAPSGQGNSTGSTSGDEPAPAGVFFDDDPSDDEATLFLVRPAYQDASPPPTKQHSTLNPAEAARGLPEPAPPPRSEGALPEETSNAEALTEETPANAVALTEETPANAVALTEETPANKSEHQTIPPARLQDVLPNFRAGVYHIPLITLATFAVVCFSIILAAQ